VPRQLAKANVIHYTNPKIEKKIKRYKIKNIYDFLLAVCNKCTVSIIFINHFSGSGRAIGWVGGCYICVCNEIDDRSLRYFYLFLTEIF